MVKKKSTKTDLSKEINIEKPAKCKVKIISR